MKQGGMKPGEKRMLMLLMVVVVVAGYLLLTGGAPSGKKLLPAAMARQKYQDADLDRNKLEKEMEALKPRTAVMTYEEDPDAVVPTVVKKLQEVAAKTGIHIREIKPLRTRKMGTLTKVPMSVRFTTEFRKSIPFLYQIEAPEGKLVVEKVSITAPDPKKPTVELDVQVALFTRGGAAAATPSEPTNGTKAKM